MNADQPRSAAPLNLAQLGVVMSSVQAPDSPTMTISVVAVVRPGLQPGPFAEAIRRSEADLEGARVVVVPNGDGWEQRVDDSLDRELTVVDLRDHPSPQVEADAVIERLAARAIPLTGAEAQVQNVLVLESDEQSRWLVMGQHAVADGISSQILRQRIMGWYAHLALAAPAPEPLRVPAADAWALAQPPASSEVLAAWQEHLGALPDRLVLSRHPGRLDAPTRRVDVRLDGETTQAFARAGGARSWTHPAIGLLAAYVARLTGQPRVVLGFVTAGRDRGTERAFTMLARVVPLPLDVTQDATLAELSCAAKAGTRAVRDLGAVTAEELRSVVPAAWRLGRVHGPIINIIPFETELQLPGHEVASDVVNRGPAEDVQLVVTPAGDGLVLELRANGWAYTDEEADLHARRLARLAELAAAEPARPLLDLDPAVDEDVRARATLAERTGEQVVDLHGRPGLVGELGAVLTHDGAATGRLVRLRTDGSLDELGAVDEYVTVGGHVVVPREVEREAVAVPGVERAEVRLSGRKAAVDVVTDGTVDAGLVRERLAAVLPVGVRPHITLHPGG